MEFIKINNRVLALTVDNDGNIYYFTEGDNTLWKFSKTNKINRLFQVHNASNGYRGIVQRGEFLYMTRTAVHSIDRYSLVSGKLNHFAGIKIGYKDGALSNCQFEYPWGITIDNTGDLYITDDHFIRKIGGKLESVQTICGQITSGHKDGDALSSRFHHPSGICVSSDGIVYIADCHNHCIRKFHNGIVSTIAGKPKRKGHKDGTLAECMLSFPRSMTLVGDMYLYVADDTGIRRIVLGQDIIGTRAGTFLLLASDTKGTVFAATSSGIQKFSVLWEMERFLWIGNKKEDPKICCLAQLPRDIVREIIAYLRYSVRRQWALQTLNETHCNS